MQFNVIGFLIFLAFFLPGFLAQKARDSIAPRSLKPHSPVADVGEFVLAGVWVHILLIVFFRLFFVFFAKYYFAAMQDVLHLGHPQDFFWRFPKFTFGYLILSLSLGYILGGIQGWLILRQPVRNWLLNNKIFGGFLLKLGVFGFLQEHPVWFYAFQQKAPRTQVFVEVEMRDGRGFYTGELQSYGIVDDSEENKDFYIVDVHYKQARSDEYVRLPCNGLLLNAKNVTSLQVFKTVSPLDA